MAGRLDRLSVRSDPVELRRVREFVRERAGACGLPAGVRFQATLVATEAVANAIRHGSSQRWREPPIELSCRCEEGGFVIEVGDSGSFRPSAPAADGSNGRGLALIARLTGRFDLETRVTGTRLRMLMERPGRACAEPSRVARADLDGAPRSSPR
jgi:anti-sigma regulatory factor (Ser/Thr protein kinase)